MKIDILKPDQSYEARGIVMRAEQIGHFDEGMIRTPIYKYISFDCGTEHSYCAEFVSPAEWVDTPQGKFLNTKSLTVGQIVVAPGFIYKKIPWTSALMTAHLHALKFYKPKDILIADEAGDLPAFDLGAINKPH